MEQANSARGLPGSDSRREGKQQKIDLNHSTTSGISRAGPALKTLIVCIIQVIDDSVTSNVSLQFKDLADFFPQLPAGARVRVAYAASHACRVVIGWSA